jgi:hypothetical protein
LLLGPILTLKVVDMSRITNIFQYRPNTPGQALHYQKTIFAINVVPDGLFESTGFNK